MTVAHAQSFAIPKPLFSGIPISRRPPYCVSFRQFTDVNIPKPLFSGTPISRRPPYCVYSRQFTDDSDKFAFLDTVDDSPWPMLNDTRYEVFIKRSYLKSDATEQEKMDFYVETADRILYGFYLGTATRSEDVAKERIYKVSRDCSICAFGFEMCDEVADGFFLLDSVETVCEDCTELEYIDGEMVKWSMKPTRREKGRFPIPKPELPWR
ncbi:hypothetical protein CASFOL_003946 [Castilleja foliolosa]|uniref:Uncharacterized protein n=1 Tax=Castilleja foliolosa TaxID=1961234 RepID=A0ABD3EME9_9LAMI